jgi:hypothetical protein
MTEQARDGHADDATTVERGPDPTEPIRDQDVQALTDALEADADLDVRVDVNEASEHIGTGTDR